MLALRVAFVIAAATAEELIAVHVYEGPTECDEADRVEVGDQLRMHYTGTIDEASQAGEPGTQFDSSRGREPLEVTVGIGRVIQGLDKGLRGLCGEGVKAAIVIPPDLGYGSSAGRHTVHSLHTVHLPSVHRLLTKLTILRTVFVATVRMAPATSSPAARRSDSTSRLSP